MQGSEGVANDSGKGGRLPLRKHETALITLERFQKLDLLIHLISNLKSSLVLCGPRGIGKTRLLSELIVCKKDVWPILTIQGASNLSFESIQDQLSRFSKQYFSDFNSLDFSGLLNNLDKKNQKIILIIDDAGSLMPGLMDTVIQYAASNSCLRIIFSLTHDELHLKNSSDKAIDNCHYIEMPPLTEKQCGIFLQSLSAQPNAPVSFKAINDRMIGRLYKETHGIPGKIVAELPKLSNYNAGSNFKKLGLVLIGCVLVFIVSHFISNESDIPILDKVNLPLIVKEPEYAGVKVIAVDRVAIKIEEDKVIDQFPEKNEAVSLISDNIELTTTTDNEPDKNILIKNEVESQKLSDSNNVQKKANQHDSNVKKIEVLEVKVKPIVEVLNASLEKNNKIKSEEFAKVATKLKQENSAETDNNRWVLKQPQENHTIQLMVLSELKSVRLFMKRNHTLKDNLKFFKKNIFGKKQYLLIYGSFKNAKDASKKMKSLPIKYRKSWVRRFKVLQKLIIN